MDWPSASDEEVMMFLQVIQGRVADGGQLRASLDQWADDLAPGADGWLGTTAGVAADGTAIVLVRFESPQAAQRNGGRPEQTAWWAQTAAIFAGDATFFDYPDVDTFLRGGSDDAGFVQIIQGRTGDASRLRDLMGRTSPILSQFRPEIIGGVVGYRGDGHVTQAVYFTSEADARTGERQQPPPEARALLEEEGALLSEQVFFDLTDPWFYSPR